LLCPNIYIVFFKEYGALKRPDLAKNENRLEVEWPRPERTYICIVCGQDVATIKCIECDNRCCRSCVRRNFSEHLNPEAGEFVPSDIVVTVPPIKGAESKKSSSLLEIDSWTNMFKKDNNNGSKKKHTSKQVLKNGQSDYSSNSATNSAKNTGRSGNSTNNDALDDIWARADSDKLNNSGKGIIVKKKSSRMDGGGGGEAIGDSADKSRSIIVKKKSSRMDGGGGGGGGGEAIGDSTDKSRSIVQKKGVQSPLTRGGSESTVQSEDNMKLAVITSPTTSTHNNNAAAAGVKPLEFPELAFSPQTFLLIHHIYCLRNGRPSRDFLNGLHHYENRKKSNHSIKKHHMKRQRP
jgi:hypothetical protein